MCSYFSCHTLLPDLPSHYTSVSKGPHYSHSTRTPHSSTKPKLDPHKTKKKVTHFFSGLRHRTSTLEQNCYFFSSEKNNNNSLLIHLVYPNIPIVAIETHSKPCLTVATTVGGLGTYILHIKYTSGC